MDIEHQPKLAIPVLKDNKIRGVVLEVLSVAFHDQNHTPMVTVRKNKTIKSYLLPTGIESGLNSILCQLTVQPLHFPARLNLAIYLMKKDTMLKYYRFLKICKLHTSIC